MGPHRLRSCAAHQGAHTGPHMQRRRLCTSTAISNVQSGCACPAAVALLPANCSPFMAHDCNVHEHLQRCIIALWSITSRIPGMQSILDLPTWRRSRRPELWQATAWMIDRSARTGRLPGVPAEPAVHVECAPPQKPRLETISKTVAGACQRVPCLPPCTSTMMRCSPARMSDRWQSAATEVRCAELLAAPRCAGGSMAKAGVCRKTCKACEDCAREGAAQEAQCQERNSVRAGFMPIDAA